MLAGFTHAPAVELAERLARLAPGKLGHAFFASDGASATEVALKMAFHHWANRGQRIKNRFVALAGGYHGETVGALGVTDVPIFRDAYAPLCAPRWCTVSRLDPGRRQGAGGVIASATTRSRPHRRAARAGRPACASIPRVPEARARRSAPATTCCWSDEIMTGFGRTARCSPASRRHRARPACLSKGITGGYLPLSCVLATDAVFGGSTTTTWRAASCTRTLYGNRSPPRGVVLTFSRHGT